MNGSLERRTGFLAAVVIGGFGLAIAALLLVDSPADEVRPSLAGTGIAPQATPLAATPSPSPHSGPSMVLFSNPEDGYEVMVPSTWVAGTEPDFGDPYAGVRKWELTDHGRFEDALALTIMVGDPSGSFYNCFGGFCNKAVATTLDQLAAVVDVAPEQLPLPFLITTTETSLGGEPARLEALRGNHFAGGFSQYRSVMTIHNGRPVIVQFNAWPIRYGYWGEGTVDRILNSFHFVDAPAPVAEGWETFTSLEAGFAIDLPTDWVEEPDTDPEVVWVDGRGGGLRIRVGDPTGHILNCDVPEGSPCEMVAVESIETLVELLTPAEAGIPGRIYGAGAATVSRRAVSLGPVPAVQMKVQTWVGGAMGGPRTRHYVVAVDGDNSIIIKWEPGTFHGREFQHLLSTFRFLD